MGVEIKSEGSHSFRKLLLGAILFGVIVLLALLWFLVDFSLFITQFYLDENIVQFNKGTMYMLGVGFGLLLFNGLMFIQGVFKKELTSKSEHFFTKGMVFSVILTFIFPHITHFFVNKYAVNNNYSVCDSASSRVRFYSEIYYTKTEQDCEQAAKDAE